MKTIQLIHGTLLLDDEDYEWVKELTLNSFAGHREMGVPIYYCVASFGYGREERYTKRLHRLIMEHYHGDLESKVIDHIDHNGLNNQKANMRVCEQRENCRNQRKQANRASQYKGVTVHSTGRWYARIKLDGRYTCIGVFDTERQAAIAYDLLAKTHFAEFAHFNILDASEQEVATVKALLSNPKKTKGSSQYAGVSRIGKWWVAVGKMDGKTIKIGKFSDERQAAVVRDEWCHRHGKNVHFNFPVST